MSETLSLEQLAETARHRHPNSETAVAMIADFKPDELQGARDNVVVNNAMETVDAEMANERAQSVYEREVNASGPRQTSEELRLAAASSLEAEERLKAARQKTELSSQISKTQKHLSKPMRVAAILLTAFAMGGTPAGILSATEPDRFINNPSKQDVLTEDDYRNMYKKMTVIIGVAGSAFGGLFGAFGGTRLSGREARRRARKIVAKEDQAS